MKGTNGRPLRALILAVLLWGCTSTGTYYVADPAPIEDLPHWYRQVWDTMSVCAGTVGRPDVTFDALRFYSSGLMFNDEGTALAGLFRGSARIYLHDDYVEDSFTVGHEMLHARTGLGDDHPTFLACEALLFSLPW